MSDSAEPGPDDEGSRQSAPRNELSRAVTSLLGAARQWSPIRRGYAHNERWIVGLEDGRSAFVKAAVDARTARWLRTEHKIYSSVREPVLPRMLGWLDEAELTLLVLEDLSAGFWPPPWNRERIASVLALLQSKSRIEPPAEIESLEESLPGLTGWWDRVSEDPKPFLSLGLCTPDWLERHLPTLQRAAHTAPLSGGSLVHRDVRSDNICLRSSAALLVDWNWASVGNPLLDLASWLPSLHAEGGPPPEEMLPSGGAEFAALLAGYFAANAGLPVIPHAPRVREVQLQQLRVALPWAARALGLPPP
jgi:phosphotransferase family enzyme